MRRLLVVSYLFPPLAGAGVYRWAKMAKFLPEFGWEPTVVTAAGDVRVHADAELAHDMPRTLRVRRVRDYGTKYVAAAARRLLKVPLMFSVRRFVACSRPASVIMPRLLTSRCRSVERSLA